MERDLNGQLQVEAMRVGMTDREKTNMQIGILKESAKEEREGHRKPGQQESDKDQ